MAAPADRFWLLLEAGPAGPFTSAEVKARLAAGSATWGTKACRVGATAWVPLHRLAGVGPGPPAGPAEPPAPPAAAAKCVNGARPPRGPRGRRLIAAGVALGVAGVVAAFAVRTVAPGVSAGYERGYGDTVLRYKDRSYEGAAWRKLPESAALAEAAGGSGRLLRVAGWDDENFWVATDAGRLVRHRDGVWQAVGKPDGARSPVIRAIDRDTVFVAGTDTNHTPDHLYRIGPGGAADLGELGLNQGDGCEVCPVSPGLVYCFRRNHLNPFGVVRAADGVRTEMPEHEYKESLVHSAENAPVPGHLVRELRLTRHPAAGWAWAVSRTTRGAGVATTQKLVRFRSGTWVVAADLPLPPMNYQVFTDLWVTDAGDAPVLLLTEVERRGVLVVRVGGGVTEQPVAPAPFPTAGVPARVWGVSADKYWVMDSNGTVWERAGGESRVVVRGLRQDDVEFADAWVTPTGRVVAVTDKHVYRLE